MKNLNVSHFVNNAIICVLDRVWGYRCVSSVAVAGDTSIYIVCVGVRMW